MSTFWEGVVTIALAIVTLGVVSVVVSKRAQTPQVIQAAGSAFSNALGIAEAPVTGAKYTPNLSYPSAGIDLSGSFGYS
jgi:hypothetical protein